MNAGPVSALGGRRPNRLVVCLRVLALACVLWGCKEAPGGLMSAARAGETAAARSAPAAAAPNGERPAAGSSKAYTKYPDAELRRRLSPIAFEVTQNAATEPAFNNPLWNNHEAGLYVDVASGEPLFSSTDKFDSGTGWPSFTRPVENQRVVSRVDTSHGVERTEARSRAADSHLGHIFDDGPPPAGIRYCINSAALRFVPVSELAKQGYAEYLPLFSGAAPAATTASAGAAGSNACVSPAPGEKAGCQASLEIAVLAGGCFWGVEEILRKVPGVISVDAGYTGGKTENPQYEDVHTGATGHAEAVRVVFEPSRLSYADLLEHWFFRLHDPTTKNRQGNDIGTQYRSAIFATTAAQRTTAEQVKARVAASGKWSAPITTEIVEAGPFTLAEDEHQDYLQKHPDGYTCHYMRD